MKILEFAADGSMNHKQIQAMFGNVLGRTVQLKKRDQDKSGKPYQYPHRSRQEQ